MFFGATFTVVFQLSHDDVFRRRKADGVVANGIFAGVAKRISVQVFASGGVKIRLQTGVRMDDVKMSAALPRHFLENDGGWRNVKLRRGKNDVQPGRIVRAEKNHEVNVMGRAWLAVKRRRHTAADEIADTRPVQRQREQFDE